MSAPITLEEAFERLDDFAADFLLDALREYAEWLSPYRLDCCAVAEPAAALIHADHLLMPARRAWCTEEARRDALQRFVPDRLAPERRKAIARGSRRGRAMSWPLLSIPAVRELAATDAWVCWRNCADRRTGRLTKRPFTPAGSPASATAPSTWSSYAECWAAAYVDGRHDGIGRVLVAGEGLVGIDLDDAVAASDGALAPWAVELVRTLPSYCERSPSGAGLHGWLRAAWPTSGNRRGPLEVYAAGRFLTVTGDHLAGTPATINRVDLAPLWTEHFANRSVPRSATIICTDLPPPLAAAELARLAHTRPQLRRILERRYHSASERDLALCRIAKLFGWPPGRAWALVLAVRGDGKADRADYAAKTLGLVY